MVDAGDLKSPGVRPPCGFESHSPHLFPLVAPAAPLSLFSPPATISPRSANNLITPSTSHLPLSTDEARAKTYVSAPQENTSHAASEPEQGREGPALPHARPVASGGCSFAALSLQARHLGLKKASESSRKIRFFCRNRHAFSCLMRLPAAH
jgi:hypothetical protein